MKINRGDEEAGLGIVVSDDELEDYAENPMRAMKEFIRSDVFAEECRKMYSEKVQTALVEKKNFTFVEALEETMDFWRAGHYRWHNTMANCYIPVRNTIMKKPNLLDEDMESDEFGYRYTDYDNKDTTRKRFHPLEQLSPMRGSRMAPGIQKTEELYQDKRGGKTKRTFYRWRRLSTVKSRAFSTWNGGQIVQTTEGGVSLPQRLLTIPDLATAFSPFRQ